MIRDMTRIAALIILCSSGYLVILTQERIMYTVLGVALLFAGVLQLAAVISGGIHRE